ncbi:hypothetical protein EVAR_80532_1 [Eumeta japonica]|uniref:Uncharacterized protein n=1 Tax=Eumeta variegata TaxID=151549 RepID=A0A4C1TML8_EUMVA|nr:hypothetical protein EVAR_80532_1 [Eumeta japonica]
MHIRLHHPTPPSIRSFPTPSVILFLPEGPATPPLKLIKSKSGDVRLLSGGSHARLPPYTQKRRANTSHGALRRGPPAYAAVTRDFFPVRRFRDRGRRRRCPDIVLVVRHDRVPPFAKKTDGNWIHCPI